MYWCVNAHTHAHAHTALGVLCEPQGLGRLIDIAFITLSEIVYESLKFARSSMRETLEGPEESKWTGVQDTCLALWHAKHACATVLPLLWHGYHRKPSWNLSSAQQFIKIHASSWRVRSFVSRRHHLIIYLGAGPMQLLVADGLPRMRPISDSYFHPSLAEVSFTPLSRVLTPRVIANLPSEKRPGPGAISIRH